MNNDNGSPFDITAHYLKEDTQALLRRVADLEKNYNELLKTMTYILKTVNRTIEWEEKTTASGLQLAGSSAVVKKRGTFLAMSQQIVGENAIATLVTAIDQHGRVVMVNGPFTFVVE